ncbi:trypsin, partial [Streptomyces sp. NPDC059558]
MKVQRSGAVLAAATVVLGALSLPSARADDKDPKKIYEQAAPATVRVVGKYSEGSGFGYAADRGLSVSNAQVVAGAPARQCA